MNMKTDKTRGQIYLVLVPHRDIRLIYKNYSACLFEQGFYLAFHIPWVAPLAELSRPFNTYELKNCARILKNSTKGDKIFASDTATIRFPMNENEHSLFGSQLNVSLPLEALDNEIGKKVIRFFSLPVIGTLLMEGNKTAALPVPPKVSFRAAAVANMYLLPLLKKSVTGFKWEIGKLHWLPKE